MEASKMDSAKTKAKITIESELLDSILSGVAVVDREGRLAYCNRAFAQRAGIEREQWLGRPAAELLALLQPRLFPADAAETSLRWSSDEKESMQEVEWREDGRTTHLREDSGPWRDARGNVAGRIFLYHDISREKEIDRMKSEFISVASHELRTPMTSIKGSIDLVLSGFAGQVTSETQELLEIAHKSCDRLIRLINDILDLAKIEAGQVKFKKVLLDLTDPVERAIRGVKPVADQAGVSIRLVRPDSLPQIEADKDRMEQVVTNLLGNAIKFSPENGEIVVELSLHDHWVQCAVIDRGCGIAPQDLEKVFGRFQQVGESTRKGGTGLGLAIAQGLVHEHNGKIWVESQVGQGSQFIFRVPAAPAKPAG